MPIESKILRNTYVDSMSLMALSTKVNKLPTVEQAMIGMGTDMNIQVIENVGLLTDEIKTATKADLIIVVQARTAEDLEQAFAQIDELRNQKVESTDQGDSVYSSMNQAMREDDDSSLVIFSVPGEYVAAEAMKALEKDKHIMIFSDNVSVEDEIALKNYAHNRQLLVMGPDCGTAIINGVGLCFANKVRRGAIGIVAASGTGSQEVSAQIHNLGSGISQLIGVGGRDLSEQVGGVMMSDGLSMLSADDDTAMIVLISKPPAKAVQDKIIEQATRAGKPVVVCFIGANLDGEKGNLIFARNTKEAAFKAVNALNGSITSPDAALDQLSNVKAPFAAGQQSVRGLFAGGTICDEVFYTIRDAGFDVISNVAGPEASRLQFGQAAKGNAMIDFGSDEYTQGRPHPMIDPTFRAAALLEQANDPEVAVILMDFELGFGSNENPVGVMIDAIKQAKETAAAHGRHLEIVAYVLGTDEDIQNKDKQLTYLSKAGVRVVDSAVDLGVAAVGYLNSVKGA